MLHRMMNYGELDARPTVVLTRDLIKKAMPKYKRHDDLVIVQEQAWLDFKKSMPMPVVKEENNPFSIDEDELASLMCQSIQKPVCRRMAVDKGVNNDDFRRPNIELVLGDNGIVTHKENHISYKFDVTKCMFSFGNINEKMRMAQMDCSSEIVVDLFAGIGYFSLPILIHAKAKHLYACEWNPDAIDAFKKNLVLNKIDSNKCTVIEGDNRSNRPTDVAQRVVLGILPSCLEWMKTAFECVDKSTGAILHCHDLIETKPMNDNDSNLQSSPSCSIASAGEVRTSTDKPTASTECAQSISSTSSSSHSIIEKLSLSSELEKVIQSSESDKDSSSSPVMLDKSACSSTNTNPPSTGSSAGDTQTTNNLSSSQNDSSSSHELSLNESVPQVSDRELSVYELRAQELIARIQEDVEAHDLKARLIHVQPVKSYAPHINHVVFDIKIEPKSNVTKNHEQKHHLSMSGDPAKDSIEQQQSKDDT